MNDYWISLAVYDRFRVAPVRKLVARGYIDIRSMPVERQTLFIRLGSLFFQGRSWRRYGAEEVRDPVVQLSESGREEFRVLLGLRREVGDAAVRFYSAAPITQVERDCFTARLASAGLLAGDYSI